MKPDLLQMVLDAYRACQSENMSCPWCSGRVAAEGEYHDPFCQIPRLFAATLDGRDWCGVFQANGHRYFVRPDDPAALEAIR